VKPLPIFIAVFLVVGFILGFTLGSLASLSTKTVTVFGGTIETETLTSYTFVEKVVTLTKPTTIVSLSEKTIINTITMTVTKTFYKTDRSINASCIVFRTSKDVYKMSEEVIIVLKNNCNYALVLPNSAPWVVTDADGRVVYSPIALQVIREVSPGGELKWVWEQRDNGGGQVPLGTYYARIFTLNGGVFVVEFKIIEV